MKWPTLTPAARPTATTAVPRAPLWVTNAMGPGSIVWSKAWLMVGTTAFQRFTLPTEFGPQIRLPRGAFWADLGVAGRQHERHADLAGLAFLERAHHALHRDRDDEEVDGT